MTPPRGTPSTKSYLSMFFVIFVILTAGTALTAASVRVQDRRMRSEFLIQARILKDAIDVDMVRKLTGSTVDLNSPVYMRLKKQLASARSMNPRCRFAYLMGQKPDGSIFFFVDSEQQYSKDYSPPGQIYTEVSRPLLEVFSRKKEAVEGPLSDRWGSWVSALVPVSDPDTGETVAVLGMDIDARNWMALIIYYSLSPALVTLLILIFWEISLFIQRRNEREKARLAESRTALQDSEASFRHLFENMADGVAIYRAVEDGNDFVFVNMNKNGERISRVRREDVMGRKVTAVFPSVGEIGLLDVFRRVWRSGVSEYLPGLYYKDSRIEHWCENYVLKLPSGLIVAIYSNITKREKAEEEIRGLAKCLAENPNPVLRISKDGILLLVNQAGLKQLSDWRLQLGKAVPQVLRDLASRALESGADQQCDIGYGGQLFSFYVTPIRESGYVNLYGLNITESRAIEKELNWKTELLEAEKEAALDGLLVVDESGRSIMTNKRLFELWQTPLYVSGSDNSWAFQQHVMELVKNPGEFLDKVVYLYSHREEVGRDEVELKDGRVFYTYSCPVIDKSGKYLGRIWNFRDITESKQAERKILEYTERLTYLTKYSNDLIMLLDENCLFLEFNERVKDVYGYSREELAGRHAAFLRAPQSREAFSQQTMPALDGGRVVYETLHQRKNGDVFPVEISFNSFDINGRRFYQAVIRDITERKKAEEKLNRALNDAIRSREIVTNMLDDNNRIRGELEDSLEKLEKTQAQLIHAEKMEAIGRMASGVAHEVKNPLGVILQGVNYLQGLAPEKDKDTGDILKMMLDSVKRADNIVRALLDFSRAEELREEYLDINTVITHSIELVRGKLEANSVEPVCELEKNLPRTLVDKCKMEQVFINLFNNAADAMPGGGRLSVRTRSLVRRTFDNSTGNRRNDNFHPGEKVIAVEIEDTGIGIDESVIGKIFDPFFTTKNRTEGTGLGLSVAKSIIEMHRSLIKVESKKGEGTKFTITLKISGGENGGRHG